MISDEEKIIKLQEEKQKLIEELKQAQEETKLLENEIENQSIDTNSMDDDKKQ